MSSSSGSGLILAPQTCNQEETERLTSASSQEAAVDGFGRVEYREGLNVEFGDSPVRLQAWRWFFVQRTLPLPYPTCRKALKHQRTPPGLQDNMSREAMPVKP